MNINFQFESLRSVRRNIQETLADFSIEQLNEIPKGYNNNLIWHYGHVLITQQRLCYLLANTPMLVDDELGNMYKIGTKPERFISQEEYQQLQELDAKQVSQVELDYKNGVFGDYRTYTTSFGITLESVEAAISFNNVHEGIHLGNMISMRRLVLDT